MLKNVIFLNLIFILTLLVYFCAQNLRIGTFSNFYLMFSIFCICSSLILLLTDLDYKSEEDRGVYRYFFTGLLVYGFANLLWFFNDSILNGVLDLNFLNILFIFQTLSKYTLLIYLTDSQKVRGKFLTFIMKLNLLFLIFGLFICSYKISLDEYFNYFFIFESIVGILFTLKNYNNLNLTLIDFRYFIAGSTLWLLGDLYYLFDLNLNIYYMGNIVDFVYFLGFYLLLSSILYNNFSWDEKINLLVEKQLFYI